MAQPKRAPGRPRKHINQIEWTPGGGQCRTCGRELSSYNRTGRCFRHQCDPDSNAEWEPTTRATDHALMLEAFDPPPSEMDEMTASPGSYAMRLTVLLLLFLLAAPAFAQDRASIRASYTQYVFYQTGCFQAIEVDGEQGGVLSPLAWLHACDDQVVSENYFSMSDNEIRVWYLQARRIYYIKTHRQLRRPR